MEQAGRMSLLDADPELARLVPEEHRARVRPTLVAPVYAVDSGPVELAPELLHGSVFALLVLDGALMHSVTFGARALSELVLPGDVVIPLEPSPDAIPTARSFAAIEPTRLIALDQRFVRAASLWPALMMEVSRRLAEQEHRVGTHGVICQLSRVEQRLLAVMWHLAGRAGRVSADGTVLPLKMPHEQLGRLIGAQRPTVSLALRALTAEGAVRRRDDG